MGVLPVCLSAGELEDEWAGEPGRRLRERYAFAGAAAAAARGGWARLPAWSRPLVPRRALAEPHTRSTHTHAPVPALQPGTLSPRGRPPA